MASGTKDSRYHPDYFPKQGNHSQTSIKVLSRNGGNRIPLLTARGVFTGSTQEAECPIHPFRLAPTAVSLQHPERATFRQSLYRIKLCFNFYHKIGQKSMGFCRLTGEKRTGLQPKIQTRKAKILCRKMHRNYLTFLL